MCRILVCYRCPSVVAFACYESILCDLHSQCIHHVICDLQFNFTCNDVFIHLQSPAHLSQSVYEVSFHRPIDVTNISLMKYLCYRPLLHVSIF